MLGVCCQTVTLVATTLQEGKFIQYRRGVIKILNRSGLEAAACECYETAKAAYDSIMKE